ncbi:MAG: oxidoreductase [Candidatus Acidiferrales bacterium]
MHDSPKTAKPLQVALVGYGMASKTFHAPLLMHVPGLRLSHIVSSDSAKVKRDWDLTVLPSPQDAFALPEIDLIVIATPNATHFDLAQAALSARKHVVVDKPFTNTVHQAIELIALARKKQCLLSVFQSRRWDGDFLTLRKLLAAGELGKITHFESRYDRYRPEPRARWREQNVPGGGLWFDLGPHLVDQALQLFGMPDAIYADMEIQRPQGQVVDYFHVILRYGPSRIIVHGSSLVAGESPRFTIHGALGSYIKFGMDTQEESLKRGDAPGSPGWGHDPNMGTLTVKSGDGFEKTQVANEAGNYLKFYQGIRDAITKGAPNPVLAEEGLAVINVLETAVKSSAARSEIPFKPITAW